MILKTEQEIEKLGQNLGQKYKSGGVIFLTGELGAGKTTLVRGALRSLGVAGAVKSPTYTIVETYELPELTVRHFDLYRLGDVDELEAMGFRDYLDPANLVFIEWPKIADNLIKPDCMVSIEYHPEGRKIEIHN